MKIFDLRVSADRCVAGLVLLSVSLLLLRRIKLRCWLLSFVHSILIERKICFVRFWLIVRQCVMISSYRTIFSPIVLIQRLVPNTCLLA